jgi:hypothetical protein
MSNLPLPQFWAADGLKEGCRFCAALGIVPAHIQKLPQLLNAGIENGTLTFLEHDGFHYGVTCWHVIEDLHNRNTKYGAGRYICATLKDGTYGIADNFRRPSAPFGSNKQPDIAVGRLPEDFAAKLGKRYYSLQPEAGHRPNPLQYAIAFGLPTEEKENMYEGAGYRVAMPCAHAVAEGIGGDTQFLSVLNHEPKIGHLSGMSGGPVFWSTADHFGLLGIIYEGNRTGAAEDFIQSPRIHFFVDRCDYDEFSRWVAELDLKNIPPTTITPVRI